MPYQLNLEMFALLSNNKITRMFEFTTIREWRSFVYISMKDNSERQKQSNLNLWYKEKLGNGKVQMNYGCFCYTKPCKIMSRPLGNKQNMRKMHYMD